MIHPARTEHRACRLREVGAAPVLRRAVDAQWTTPGGMHPISPPLLCHTLVFAGPCAPFAILGKDWRLLVVSEFIALHGPHEGVAQRVRFVLVRFILEHMAVRG